MIFSCTKKATLLRGFFHGAGTNSPPVPVRTARPRIERTQCGYFPLGRVDATWLSILMIES